MGTTKLEHTITKMQNHNGRPQQQDGGDKKKPEHFETTVEITPKARENK